MRTKLTKPIFFFDLETTGTNVTSDRIVQISFVKVEDGGENMIKTSLVKPGIPIEAGAMEVHQITEKMVADAPPFKKLAPRLNEIMEGCDLGGYNIMRFDIPLLMAEMSRAGIEFSMEGRRIIDVFKLVTAYNPRNLSAIYKQYMGKELEGAHDASADTVATYDIFNKMINVHHKESPQDVEDFDIEDFDSIHKLCMGNNIDVTGRLMKNEAGEICYNFGKNKGIPVVKDRNYASWMLSSDFTQEVKGVLRKILKNRE